MSFVTQQIRREHTHAVGGVAAHLFYFFFVVVVLFILKKKNVGTTVGASSSDIPQLPSWDKNPSYPFRHSSLYMFVFIQPKDEKMILILSWLLFLSPSAMLTRRKQKEKKMRKVNMSSNFTRQRMKKEGGNACLCLQRNEPTCSNKLLMKWLRRSPPPPVNPLKVSVSPYPANTTESMITTKQ